VIFIARSTDFHDKIDISELSTLGRIPIEFLPYSVDQISDILVTRSSESFNPKVVGTDIIDEVSLITTSSQVGGDVRYALDLLLYSGNLAEASGSDRITLEQIRKVHGHNSPSITMEDLKELPKSHLLTLMAILKVQSKRKRQYIEMKEIRAYALELAEENKVKKFEFEDCMNDLLDRKIIEMKSLKEIGMNITSLVELEPLLEQQINKK
jgi:cell division control protein 6